MPKADLSAITTICFDADQMLWDFEKTMRQALAWTLEELESRLPSVR